MAGLLGSAAGHAAGSIVGPAIDGDMFDAYRHVTSGHAFNAQHA
ncbi:hypothetical protein [Caballeronia sp. HLA56]